MAATGLFIMAGPLPTSADHTNCTVPAFLFVGGDAIGTQNSRGVHKAVATMRDRVPSTCVGDEHGDASTWTAITAQPRQGVGTEYAQIGYGLGHGQASPRGFAQYNIGDCDEESCSWFGFQHVEFLGTSNWYSENTDHTYRVYVRDNTDGVGLGEFEIAMSVDGSIKLKTPWDPHNYWTPNVAWVGEFASEAHDSRDDIAGSEMNKMIARSIRIAECVACALEPATLNLFNDQPGTYFMDPPGLETCVPNCFNSWTNRINTHT